MKWLDVAIFVMLAAAGLSTQAAAQSRLADDRFVSDSWVKELKDRTQRGTLQDAFQKVRGDSGKWNDDPLLEHAPPIARKPPKTSLDDWTDLVRRTRKLPLTSEEDNWLLLKTKQLDDNDRVWIERIERKGNQVTVVLNQAIWRGRYFKTFTYYNVYGINLGKFPPGQYAAKVVIKPLTFQKFEGNGRPVDDRRTDNWPADEAQAEKAATELTVDFSVQAD